MAVHEGRFWNYGGSQQVGGGSAAAVVVAGWWLWDRGWYRWITYFPWGVLAFTYVFLVRLGDTAPRIEAAPAVFGPVLALLAAALLVRIWSDISGGAAVPTRDA